MICPYIKRIVKKELEFEKREITFEEYMPCYEKECPHYVDKEYCQRADAEASGRLVTK